MINVFQKSSTFLQSITQIAQRRKKSSSILDSQAQYREVNQKADKYHDQVVSAKDETIATKNEVNKQRCSKKRINEVKDSAKKKIKRSKGLRKKRIKRSKA